MGEFLIGDAQGRIDARAETAVDRVEALLNVDELPGTEERSRDELLK